MSNSVFCIILSVAAFFLSITCLFIGDKQSAATWGACSIILSAMMNK